jgi:hypothetical protein
MSKPRDVGQSIGTSSLKTGPRQRVAQVQGLLAESVVISTLLDPFLSLKALAGYSDLSVRKLRQHLEDPVHPLPCYRFGGKIVVRRSDYDTWASCYRHVGKAEVDRIVSDVLKTL